MALPPYNVYAPLGLNRGRVDKPSLVFWNDVTSATQSGIFQLDTDFDSIAFSCGGVLRGHFHNSGLTIQNDIQVRGNTQLLGQLEFNGLLHPNWPGDGDWVLRRGNNLLSWANAGTQDLSGSGTQNCLTYWSATKILSFIGAGTAGSILKMGSPPVWGFIGFNDLNSHPTTLAGYGITDAVSTSTKVIAGTGLVGGGPLFGDVTLALDVSGVAAGTYGDSGALVPAFAVDKYGRLTAAANRTLHTYDIGALPTSYSLGTQYSITGGGTLDTPRTLSLVGDAATPTPPKGFYYGTAPDSTTRGWYELPKSGGLFGGGVDKTVALWNGDLLTGMSGTGATGQVLHAVTGSVPTWARSAWSEIDGTEGVVLSSRSVSGGGSIKGGGPLSSDIVLSLKADPPASTGNLYYGCNSGSYGWFTVSASTHTILGKDSIQGGGDLTQDRTLNLVGDPAPPSGVYYYGATSGSPGWKALPAGRTLFATYAPKSNNTVTGPVSILGPIRSGESTLIPAGVLGVGSVLRMELHGLLTAPVNWAEMILAIKIGGVTVSWKTQEADVFTPVNWPWRAWVLLSIQSAGSQAIYYTSQYFHYLYGFEERYTGAGSNTSHRGFPIIFEENQDHGPVAGGTLSTVGAVPIDVTWDNVGNQSVIATCTHAILTLV